MKNEDIITTEDINIVAKIHSNPKYINWKYEYVDGVHKFYSPNYRKEETYVTLEQLEPLLSEKGFMCLGHGTGRKGNDDLVVDSIFENGLRTKDNSLYFTTIGLSTPTPEIIKQYKELGIPMPTISDLKNQFNNWQHQNSKKIIIARIPTKYINMIGDKSDLDGEMYGAFIKEVVDENGKRTGYLNSKFIVGCFDVEKQMVRLNTKFEQTLLPETIEELKFGYEKALEKTKNRIKRNELISNMVINPITNGNSYEDFNFSKND